MTHVGRKSLTVPGDAVSLPLAIVDATGADAARIWLRTTGAAAAVSYCTSPDAGGDLAAQDTATAPTADTTETVRIAGPVGWVFVKYTGNGTAGTRHDVSLAVAVDRG